MTRILSESTLLIDTAHPLSLLLALGGLCLFFAVLPSARSPIKYLPLPVGSVNFLRLFTSQSVETAQPVLDLGP